MASLFNEPRSRAIGMAMDGGTTDTGLPDHVAARHRADLAAIAEMAMRLVGELDRGLGDLPDKPTPKHDREAIRSLNTLSLVIARVIAQERQSYGPASAAPSGPPFDEQALEQRITDELDRIAARQRAAASAKADRGA